MILLPGQSLIKEYWDAFKRGNVLGSCALVNTSINHRVLIKKNDTLNTFSLFSCSLEGEVFCNFEENLIEES